VTGVALLAVEESRVTPGLLGFVVVALLGVATWLLIRSMNRQMRKVRFDERPHAADVDGRVRGDAGRDGPPTRPPDETPPGPPQAGA
jgi:hypothetical protein